MKLMIYFIELKTGLHPINFHTLQGNTNQAGYSTIDESVLPDKKELISVYI